MLELPKLQNPNLKFVGARLLQPISQIFFGPLAFALSPC